MDVVPTSGSRLEVVFSNGSRCEVVVEACAASTLRAVVRDPDVLAVAGALDVPFTVGWPGDRSWYVRPGRGLQLIGDDPRLCRIELAGEATRANRRRFVRGGGGEAIRLSAADVADVADVARVAGVTGVAGEVGEVALDGIIADLSEGGVRCRLKEFDRGPGDAAAIAIDLSGETVEAVGTVYDVRTLRRGAGAEVVVVYTLTEPEARLVRRYLFERELASRRVRPAPR